MLVVHGTHEVLLWPLLIQASAMTSERPHITINHGVHGTLRATSRSCWNSGS